MKDTTASYKTKLKERKPHVQCLEDYQGSFVRLMHRCRVHGATFETTPNNMLTKGNCPKCGKANRGAKQWTEAEFQREVKKTQALPLEYYRGSAVRIRFRCKIHHVEWTTRPAYVLRGHGCPTCKLERITKNRYQRKEHKGRVVQGYEPQAFDWMLRRGYSQNEIEMGVGAKIPVFEYEEQGRVRRYFPDAYVPKERRIVEVKSTRSMGLKDRVTFNNCKRKAAAVAKAGYKYSLLLFLEDGTRLRMPTQWWYLTCKELVMKLTELNHVRQLR